MLQELPDELNNDCIDSALLVDHWLHRSAREKEEGANKYHFDGTKRVSDNSGIRRLIDIEADK